MLGGGFRALYRYSYSYQYSQGYGHTGTNMQIAAFDVLLVSTIWYSSTYTCTIGKVLALYSSTYTCTYSSIMIPTRITDTQTHVWHICQGGLLTVSTETTTAIQ